MSTNYYEPHHLSYDFPVIFHPPVCHQPGCYAAPHWHENIELLFVRSGAISVNNNDNTTMAHEGDIVVINSNFIHSIYMLSENSSYHCLIVSAEYLEKSGIDTGICLIAPYVCDQKAAAIFLDIIKVFENKTPYYKTQMCSYILNLMTYLIINHPAGEPFSVSAKSAKSKTAKDIIRYLRQHYSEELSLDSISEHMGFTKYYICHIFKETTDLTAVEFLNYLRCDAARKLILSNTCNISEAALLCGFKNMSYFTKVYKKCTGSLPSQSAKDK